jgi:hypothetical protein
VAQGLLRRAVIGLPLDEPIVAAKKYYELNADQVKAPLPARSGWTISSRW